MQKLKMKNEMEAISKMKNKVGVEELKEDGAKFRLGRFGAQFFAPVTNEPSDISSAGDDDDDDGDEEMELQFSEFHMMICSVHQGSPRSPGGPTGSLGSGSSRLPGGPGKNEIYQATISPGDAGGPKLLDGILSGPGEPLGPRGPCDPGGPKLLDGILSGPGEPLDPRGPCDPGRSLIPLPRLYHHQVDS
ncbi:unnamed protein product [Brugia timori]|uniref:NYAP_N domain-containing protein n=1 Tax=Brugia timori TaxID=42155 RepID=A0A0R3R5I7_9BILA|nr:unnamed protein product [Brugia timori]